MKRYCMAHHTEDLEACGVDSYFPCDGRWSDRTCIIKATDHFHKINKALNLNYQGFSFYRGDLHCSTFIKYVKL